MGATRRDLDPAFQQVLDRHGWHAAGLDPEVAGLPPGDLDAALRLSLALADQEPGGDLRSWQLSMYREGRRRMFPHRFESVAEPVSTVAGYFFPLAEAVLRVQAEQGGAGIAERLPFTALHEDEITPWPAGQEYRRLLPRLYEEGVLVTLATAQQWLGFSIADHVLGVTGLCLWIGRQLARVVPVDLPLLHGAAIGHDIGKFGCIGDEERRIPRLHYFYTHQWYQARGLPGIGHIATNHSCWDLEQIRLPVETQVLIYADFRVKDTEGPDGRPVMSITSLGEAYAGIRDKLENLDQAKLRRYQGVYRKLRDLEDYLLHLGVDLDPPTFSTRPVRPPRLPQGLQVVRVLDGAERPDVASLAAGRDLLTTARLFTTAHNLKVMEQLRDLPALRALLEEARSFEGWRDLRTYVGVLGEYSPALSMEQKELALDFFFELLGHRDDDIRYHAANRIGDILALGEDFWRKDLPDGVAPESGRWVLAQVERVLNLLDLAGTEPEEDMGATEMVIYGVPVILRRLLRRADEELRRQVLDLMVARLSARVADRRPLVGLYVCEAFEIVLPFFAPEERLQLVEVAQAWAHHEAENTRLMAWRLLLGIAREAGSQPEVAERVRYYTELLGRRMVPGALVAELALMADLADACGLSRLSERCRELLEWNRNPVQEVMLRNLKSRVGWVEKKVNGDFLVDMALARHRDGIDPDAHRANEVAVHLANLLKVSRVEGTRFHAGRSLLRLLGVLTVTQRNDLMVELIRSLQLDVEAVARYIPRFLGAVLASLPDQELFEALDDMESNVRRGAGSLQRLLLQTVVWLVVHASEERLAGSVLRRLAGILLGAMVETRPVTVHDAFAQLGLLLERLSRPEHRDGRLPRLLELITVKLLTLVVHRPGDRVRFFLIASALNHLDRALLRQRSRVHFPAAPSVAFIPGTFDPFTRAHGELVERVLSSVDQVLVQVDDYSWNKHTQPRPLRKEMTWMALGPIPGAFPAPFEPPVNLANASSLKSLARKLGRRELTLVVGSDVLESASAYRDPAGHIWDYSHLIIVRAAEGASRTWEEKLGWFRARVQVAGIPPRSQSISSTTLRAALDRRDDLDTLCDPLVARTLQERQLYLNYPPKKAPVPLPEHRLEVLRGPRPELAWLQDIVAIEGVDRMARSTRAHREHLLLEVRDSHEPLAALTWTEVAASTLPVVLEDPVLAQVPEGALLGRGALVDTLAVRESGDSREVLTALFGRALSRWLDAGLQFCLIGLDEEAATTAWKVLEGYGAAWVTGTPPGDDRGRRWAAMQLTSPLVLVWDLEEALQPAWSSAPEVGEVVGRARHALVTFFSDRDTGTACIHLPETELKRQTAAWALERLAAQPDRRWVVLGLGRQFSRDVIGACPTLALELERFLTWQGYEVGFAVSHGSPSLEMQLHTARELGRDALLVAPFLDSAEPIVQAREAARAAGIVLREVLIGVTSASVHATLHLEGIPHRAGTIVPLWQAVLRESALTPYIGGWSIVGRGPLETSALLPSLNECLPYHHPHPLGQDSEAALDFSRLVLGNARKLFLELERLFRQREGRMLTLRDLGLVVRTPRCPPFPEGFVPAERRTPSELLAEDLEALARLHPERHEAHRTRWRAP